MLKKTARRHRHMPTSRARAVRLQGAPPCDHADFDAVTAAIDQSRPTTGRIAADEGFPEKSGIPACCDVRKTAAWLFVLMGAPPPAERRRRRTAQPKPRR